MTFRALAVIAALAIAPAAHAAFNFSVHIDPFFQPLTPYGQWVDTPDYGTVFEPDVGPDWRPYVEGHWAWSPQGWLWVSSEPFGWALYHYGRFVVVDGRWAWIPGDRWAPACVTWREDPDDVGWVPYGFEDSPGAFVVVERREFLDPDIVRVYHHDRFRDERFYRDARVEHRAPRREIIEREAGHHAEVRSAARAREDDRARVHPPTARPRPTTRPPAALPPQRAPTGTSGSSTPKPYAAPRPIERPRPATPPKPVAPIERPSPVPPAPTGTSGSHQPTPPIAPPTRQPPPLPAPTRHPSPPPPSTGTSGSHGPPPAVQHPPRPSTGPGHATKSKRRAHHG